MNIHQISKVTLDPSVIDGIVFWTQNPIPMLDRLNELKAYTYYFQFTITPYGQDVEQNIPSKRTVIIPTFQKLSKTIGAERVIWRYDPILLTPKYSIDWHVRCFEIMANELAGYTRKCVFSFQDMYKNTQNNANKLGLLPLGEKEMVEIALRFSDTAQSHGLILETCSEAINLEQYGIHHGHCIDCSLFEELLGCKLHVAKDKNQRVECGCVASIDIGMYNTCMNHCLYCYANYNQTTVDKNHSAHDPNSPLISGTMMPDDVIKERKVQSCKDCQLNMFSL